MEPGMEKIQEYLSEDTDQKSRTYSNAYLQPFKFHGKKYIYQQNPKQFLKYRQIHYTVKAKKSLQLKKISEDQNKCLNIIQEIQNRMVDGVLTEKSKHKQIYQRIKQLQQHKLKNSLQVKQLQAYAKHIQDQYVETKKKLISQGIIQDNQLRILFRKKSTFLSVCNQFQLHRIMNQNDKQSRASSQKPFIHQGIRYDYQEDPQRFLEVKSIISMNKYISNKQKSNGHKTEQKMIKTNLVDSDKDNFDQIRLQPQENSYLTKQMIVQKEIQKMSDPILTNLVQQLQIFKENLIKQIEKQNKLIMDLKLEKQRLQSKLQSLLKTRKENNQLGQNQVKIEQSERTFSFQQNLQEWIKKSKQLCLEQNQQQLLKILKILQPHRGQIVVIGLFEDLINLYLNK